ncbi:LIC_12616 family protein [Paenibacillus sp. F4]|uniref:phage neck terminator protein n=1 Tax=Paenibacillus sp. F4 TaxID=357385 RepID=UPI000C9F14BF|nr:hypothetical protein [Paenibacillus sp. F4]PNQ81957.1 hypothetical protein C1T21_06710 [Paenibacillus sp. F4]
MIQYNDIRKVWAEGIKKDLAIQVINMNGTAAVPTGSFLTYTFEGVGEGRGQPVYTQENNRLVQRETVEFTVSFMSSAEDHITAVNIALRVQDWLRTIGRNRLKELDVVVYNIGPLDNRDIVVGNEWERRMGFDVDFRTTSVTDQDLEYIEKVKIANKIIT